MNTIDTKHQAIINACQQWLKNVVIKYNFCPFARKEFDAQTIEYIVCPHQQPQPVLAAIQAACQQLDNHPNISTSLIILPHGFERFDDYLDLVDSAQQHIIDPNYEGIYQLASFHPNYCFAGSDQQDL